PRQSNPEWLPTRGGRCDRQTAGSKHSRGPASEPNVGLLHLRSASPPIGLERLKWAPRALPPDWKAPRFFRMSSAHSPRKSNRLKAAAMQVAAGPDSFHAEWLHPYYQAC